MAKPLPDKAGHARVLGLEDRVQSLLQAGPLLQSPRDNLAPAQSPSG